MRVSHARLLLVDAARVIGILVYGGSSFFFQYRLLDFPVVLFDADTEFEIFASDGIPVLL
jgi:hypothetical protein